jgi:hypothetical protein
VTVDEKGATVSLTASTPLPEPSVTATPTLANGQHDPEGLHFAMSYFPLTMVPTPTLFSDAAFKSCSWCTFFFSLEPQPALSVAFVTTTVRSYEGGSASATTTSSILGNPASSSPIESATSTGQNNIVPFSAFSVVVLIIAVTLGSFILFIPI